jgi:hypothetical protein
MDGAGDALSVQTIETSDARALAASPASCDWRDNLPPSPLRGSIDTDFLPDDVLAEAEERHRLENPPPPLRGGGHAPDLARPTREEERFWHSQWSPHRSALRAALERTGSTAASLEAWDCCGGRTWVMKHKTEGSHRLASQRCHHRLCLPCQRARSRLISGNVRKALTGRFYLHVVLTMAHTYEPLAKQIDRIYRSFKRLRSRPLWRTRCQGGAAFLEITRNVDRETWHVHLHIIAEARFIPHQDYVDRAGVHRLGLSSTWSEITGGSRVVWVENVRDRAAAAVEVAKYVTKPLAPALFADTDALDEFVLAIRAAGSASPSAPGTKSA